jgi:nucleotidyltransferase substrate binding protein (TIGR01987 family)
MQTQYTNIPSQIKQAVYEIMEFQDVALVAIFGSRSRGDHKERSDIDIAIKLKKTDRKLFNKIEEQILASSLLMMDIVDYDQMDAEMQAYIKHDGQILVLNKKWFINLVRLGDAIKSLGVSLSKELDADNIVRDSVIQRFEYTIEMFWKALKHLLEDKGKLVNLPRDVLEAAYAQGWIDDSDDWLMMMKDRNETSHTYKEKVAVEIYKHIKANFIILEKTYNKLHKEFIENINLKDALGEK